MFERPPVPEPQLTMPKRLAFLVEQESAFAELLCEALAEANVDCTWVENYHSAMEGAQELHALGVRPDVLILNAQVSEKKGLLLYEKLSELRGWKAVPCVFFSDCDNESLILEAYEKGAYDFLQKTTPTNIFQAKIRSILSIEEKSTTQTAQDYYPGAVFDNRYCVLSKLGHGGQSVVYLVKDLQTRQKRALKSMNARALQIDPLIATRFHREIRTQIGIKHPHLIRVYDIGFFGSMGYYVMDYLPNGSLAKRLLHSPLGCLESLEIAYKLTSALTKIHEHGMIHRDIKPENILFSKEDQPVLTDLGLVSTTETQERITSAGIVIGTPEFMSPERLARSSDLDPRIDIYSMGIVLYLMLTGKTPFDDIPATSIYHAVQRGLSSPSQWNPALPEQVSAICIKATLFDPKERYQNAEELLEALHHAIFSLSTKAKAIRDKKEANDEKIQ